MMPALIQAGWFTKGEASYLSVATLVGYLLGAHLTEMLTRYFTVTTLVRASMLACALGYLACMFQGLGMPWYLLWRTGAGVGGAILMVLTAPLVLARHSLASRGRVSGIVFSGIGLGAMLAGVLVPLLIGGLGLSLEIAGKSFDIFRFHGLIGAWVGMGLLCLMLTILSWRQWPLAGASAPVARGPGATPPSSFPRDKRVALALLWVAYTLNAIGYLPHTMFWVDYIVRELHLSLASGGFFWSVFGIGAAIGPLLMGTLADTFGLKRCLLVGFFLKAVGVALPLFSSDAAALFASSLLVGIFTPGLVALVSAYVLDCLGANFHRRAWGLLTTGFAAAQAIVGFGMAHIAGDLPSYLPLFAFSAACLLISMVCIALITEGTRRPHKSRSRSSSDAAGRRHPGSQTRPQASRTESRPLATRPTGD